MCSYKTIDNFGHKALVTSLLLKKLEWLYEQTFFSLRWLNVVRPDDTEQIGDSEHGLGMIG